MTCSYLRLGSVSTLTHSHNWQVGAAVDWRPQCSPYGLLHRHADLSPWHGSWFPLQWAIQEASMDAAMSLMAHFQKSLTITSSKFICHTDQLYLMGEGATQRSKQGSWWRGIVEAGCSNTWEHIHEILWYQYGDETFLGARTDMQPMSNLFHSAQFPDILDLVQVYLLAQ